MANVVERCLPRPDSRRPAASAEQLANTPRQPDAAATALHDRGSTVALAKACVCRFEPHPDAAEANHSVGLPFDRVVAAMTVTPTKGEPR